MPTRSVWARTALILGMVCATGCGLEKSWIYFPDPRITGTPADAGIPFEDITLKTVDGVRIDAWFVPKGGARGTLLWLHGNGGNLSNRVESIRAHHANLDMNILMIDYRGYGKSRGRIDEEGTYLDAEAAFDYLAGGAGLPFGRIVVLGQSLGSAVAVELALRRRPDALILVSPFTSIRDMARKTLPWIPVGPLLSVRYDSLSKMNRIDVPLLVLHGDRDGVVPVAQGRRIFDAAPEPKTFYTISGAGHNDTFEAGGADYFEAIRKFLDGLSDGSG